MRILTLITSIVFQVLILNGQTSFKELNLENGPYKVGFKQYSKDDSTRTYQIHNEFNNQIINRPISVSIWYPANIIDGVSQQLTILEYLEVLKEEEEWKYLPDYFLLDWFPYLWNTPENRKHLSENTTAFSNTEFVNEKFPVIIYAASYQASSIENFGLFEYLASNGYVVISSPSRGTESRWLEGATTKEMETQSKDIEFLIKEIKTYDSIDSDKIALMGFSFGGLSNAITVMKNKNIGALISLDGAERYAYDVLKNSPYFKLDNFNIPYVHFAQKEIPEIVLKEDKIPEELNYSYQLYDSLRFSDVYSYRFNDLSHSYFSSFGVLFGNRDKRQDKSDDTIMASYKLLSEHTLQFLNATLKDDKKAREFLENSPEENGFHQSLISKKMKKSQQKEFNYKNFNDLALGQDFRDLIQLYDKTILQYPNLKLEEGMLNMLGLRLSFDPKRSEKGINVLLLALYIYPESANLFDSLAEAYYFNKDFKNAIDNYKKSLALNPENENAIKRLKQLEE